jgi:LPS-assembly lipoprotein
MFPASYSTSLSEQRHARWPAALLLLTALTAATLAGCGFQLRGVIPLPPEMSATYIDTADRFSDLYASLRLALEANNVRVVEQRTQADAVLRITGEDSGERVLSVSARNIPREFEVFYTVNFELLLNGRQRLVDQRVSQTRSYTWRETEVLGKAEEGRRVRRALADDLAVRMLRRLSSAENEHNDSADNNDNGNASTATPPG